MDKIVFTKRIKMLLWETYKMWKWLKRTGLKKTDWPKLNNSSLKELGSYCGFCYIWKGLNCPLDRRKTNYPWLNENSYYCGHDMKICCNGHYYAWSATSDVKMKIFYAKKITQMIKKSLVKEKILRFWFIYKILYDIIGCWKKIRKIKKETKFLKDLKRAKKTRERGIR